jgi:ribonuclease BN (tRNA processing enzyme)
MRIRALGIHGGMDPAMATTSFLIDDRVAVDAGSIATRLSVKSQLAINHIFISHSHLDHIKDLAFLADTVCDDRGAPVKVYSSAQTIEIIKKHFFNNVIWPDFSKIPTPENPTVEFIPIPLGGSVHVENLRVQAIPVNHPVPALGFIIQDETSSVVISGDTGPTDELWSLARKVTKDSKRPLEAIITEVSFPNRMQDVADLAGHFTPAKFEFEVRKKFPKDVPIYLYHLKPPHWDEVMSEVKSLGLRDVVFLELEDDIHLGKDALKDEKKNIKPARDAA